MEQADLHGYPLPLIKLYGIERGWLKYLPQSVPAIRAVKAMLDDIFTARTPIEIAGHQCLFKPDIAAAIHLRVIPIMGHFCIVCNIYRKKDMNVHHIKPASRTWCNAWGFTTLCQGCHKIIRVGLSVPDEEMKSLCREFASLDSPYYDPPGMIYPEPNIVKLPHINYFYEG
jgi:hypothetical protein